MAISSTFWILTTFVRRLTCKLKIQTRSKTIRIVSLSIGLALTIHVSDCTNPDYSHCYMISFPHMTQSCLMSWKNWENIEVIISGVKKQVQGVPAVVSWAQASCMYSSAANPRMPISITERTRQIAGSGPHYPPCHPQRTRKFARRRILENTHPSFENVLRIFMVNFLTANIYSIKISWLYLSTWIMFLAANGTLFTSNRKRELSWFEEGINTC